MKRHKRYGGFTLVEVAITVTVIAVLATVVVVAYNGHKDRSDNTARITAVRQLVNMVKQYNGLNGPEGLTTLIPDNTITCLGVAADQDAATAGYQCRVVMSNTGVSTPTSEIPAFTAALGTVGTTNITYPLLVRNGTTGNTVNFGGPVLTYTSTTTVDGDPGPWFMAFYLLRGNDIDCGQPNAKIVSGANYTMSGVKNNSSAVDNNGSVTFCNVPIKMK